MEQKNIKKQVFRAIMRVMSLRANKVPSSFAMVRLLVDRHTAFSQIRKLIAIEYIEKYFCLNMQFTHQKSTQEIYDHPYTASKHKPTHDVFDLHLVSFSISASNRKSANLQNLRDQERYFQISKLTNITIPSISTYSGPGYTKHGHSASCSQPSKCM
ncbi:hypothetical protein BGX38DRAFT_1178043 [Terfezia claveryi]|nr:hypothetical protein BGX38DRAFT_1178043 [Terfezia claveryi]